LDDLRAFPESARRQAGFQLDRVQQGREPTDWKPIATVGAGVKEIRIRDASGAFRVLYVAKLADAVFVLHCFQKKTQKTSQRDLDLAGKRYRELMQEIGTMSDRFNSVWDAIENTPEEAENMRLRSRLMMALEDHITRAGMTQADAARILGVTQPRVSDLMRGKIDRFGLDTLVNMAVAAGLHVHLTVDGDAA
jgi:phage-related protein/predicted XRE-type DNA-binding protein